MALPASIAEPAGAARRDTGQPHWIYVFPGDGEQWCFFVADAHPILDEFGYPKFGSVENGVKISISSTMGHMIFSRKTEIPEYHANSWWNALSMKANDLFARQVAEIKIERGIFNPRGSFGIPRSATGK